MELRKIITEAEKLSLAKVEDHKDVLVLLINSTKSTDNLYVNKSIEQ